MIFEREIKNVVNSVIILFFSVALASCQMKSVNVEPYDFDYEYNNEVLVMVTRSLEFDEGKFSSNDDTSDVTNAYTANNCTCSNVLSIGLNGEIRYCCDDYDNETGEKQPDGACEYITSASDPGTCGGTVNNAGEIVPTRPWRNFYIDMYEYPNRPGQMPMVNVDYFEAKELCEAQGKRLCFTYEWREVCRGNGENGFGTNDGRFASKGYNYPYGMPDDYDEVNDIERSPTENSQVVYQADWCNDDSSGIQPSGVYSKCFNYFISSNGRYPYDLTGNALEWVDFDYYGYLPSEKDANDCFQQKVNGYECKNEYLELKQIIGGYYFEGDNAVCNRQMMIPGTYKDNKIGFRCCRYANID